MVRRLLLAAYMQEPYPGRSREEEQESYDNLSDNFRYGEKRAEMEGYMEILDEACGYLDDANSVIEQI